MIKGDADPDHIQAIAKYVDQKMREINSAGTIKSSLKVAILAALNITDEFFKTRDEQNKQVDSYETRAQKLMDLLPDQDAAPVESNEEISLFTQK